MSMSKSERDELQDALDGRARYLEETIELKKKVEDLQREVEVKTNHVAALVYALTLASFHAREQGQMIWTLTPKR